MNNDFSSTYLQSSNGGNNSYPSVDTQPNNTGYDAPQNITYPWGMPEQPPPSAPASVSTSASLNTTPSSKGSYSGIDNNGKGIPNNKPSAITNGVGGGNSSNNRSHEYVDYTQQCVQAILDINLELIRVCIDYYNNNWLNEQELFQYKQRLQGNLSYLATVADEYNNNPRNEIKPPDLSQLPPPRGSHGKNLNSLYMRAAQILVNHKKLHRHININANNKGFTNTASSQAPPDTESSTSPRQFKLGSSSSSIMSSSSQYQQVYQKQQQSSAALQQQIPPQPPQQPQVQQQPQHPQQMQQQQHPQQMQQQIQHPQQMQQQPHPQQMHQQQQSQQPPQQQQQHSHQQSQQMHPHQHSQQSSNRYPSSMLPSVTMAAAYQQHSSSLQQNMIANNMPEYSVMTTANQEHSYQVLPPLVGCGMPVNGNVNAGNSNNVNGGGSNGQTTGILPSIIGLGDQYGMSTPQQQQQQLQLQGVGFSGFVGGGNAGIAGNTGFGPANAFGMMRYPSSGGMMNNGGIVNNNTMGNNGIGINAGYGNNGIPGNTLGLPNMLNHENEMPRFFKKKL